ncbi:MAG: hypothetical protein CMI02_19325 [Oceanospirillaceae bacterium]|nr:hypothetical protein [Oceanospirillaceae bacterium]MBT14181.1 hypothetical protein [Oceanospirillaceae bacterium]|tara:strand:+ start:33382 stop:33600 length:219 start_codon:yes stop_codon:yes gene_type:complete
MNDIQHQQIKRRIRQAVGDIDAMKAQLAEIRQCCEALSSAMRQIREDSENARQKVIRDRELAERRRQMKRVV